MQHIELYSFKFFERPFRLLEFFIVVEFATAQEKVSQKLTVLGEDGFVVSGEMMAGSGSSDSRKETSWKALHVRLYRYH